MNKTIEERVSALETKVDDLVTGLAVDRQNSQPIQNSDSVSSACYYGLLEQVTYGVGEQDVENNFRAYATNIENRNPVRSERCSKCKSPDIICDNCNYIGHLVEKSV